MKRAVALILILVASLNVALASGGGTHSAPSNASGLTDVCDDGRESDCGCGDCDDSCVGCGIGHCSFTIATQQAQVAISELTAAMPPLRPLYRDPTLGSIIRPPKA